MPWLLMLAGKIGIPAQFQRIAVIGAGVLLLVIAAFAVVKIHDHRVIAAHRAAQDAANSKADRKADNHSAEQRGVDQGRQTAETEEINNAVSEARRTGGDARAAYYHCVQLQQSARAAKRLVPSCG